MHIFLLAALIFASTPGLVQADSHETAKSRLDDLIGMSLEELVEVEVSLATGSPKSSRLAPAAATVITAADIERMGATTLDEVLETVPGLHVAPSPTTLFSSIYSIRGIHTGFNPQVLMMYDSASLQFPNTGARIFLFKMPVAAISRVEIVRGPGSALHGADALAGTINIIPKNGEEIDGVGTGVRYGSFDAFDAWAQGGGQLLGWEAALTFEYQMSNGDDGREIESDFQTIFDGLMGTDASQAPGSLNTDYKLFDAHLGLSRGGWNVNLWSLIQRDAGPGAGAANALTEENDIDFEQILAGLKHKGQIGQWENSFALNYLYQNGDFFYQLFPPNAELPIGEDGNIGTQPFAGVVRFTDGSFGNPMVKDQALSTDFSFTHTGLVRHRPRVGFGLKYQKEETEQQKNNGSGVLDSHSATILPPPAINEVGPEMTDVTGTEFVWLDDNSRTIWHGYVHDEWNFSPGWELTAGLRYDHYSDFGGTVNPRMALVWETSRALTMKALYGRAFRPPSFTEQYAINNPINLGNRALEPETIHTGELVFEFLPSPNLFTRLSLFAYKIQDLIDYVADPSPATTVTAQNARDQDGRGFEVEMGWEITESLHLHSDFAYQRAVDKQSGDPVADAPQMQFSINPQWTFSNAWSLDAQYRWIGNRPRASGDDRDEIDDYGLASLTLRRRKILRFLDVSVAGRNLFDQDAREPGDFRIPKDYPMEGRSFWVEARFSF